MRSDPDDLCLTNTAVNEFAVQAFRDELQHLISLFLARDLFVALLVHPCRHTIARSDLKSTYARPFSFPAHPAHEPAPTCSLPGSCKTVREGFEPSVPFWGTAL